MTAADVFGSRPHACWRVVVRYPRNSGRLGFFKSDLMTYTEGRALLLKYHRTGQRAYLEEDPDSVELHREIIQLCRKQK